MLKTSFSSKGIYIYGIREKHDLLFRIKILKYFRINLEEDMLKVCYENNHLVDHIANFTNNAKLLSLFSHLT